MPSSCSARFLTVYDSNRGIDPGNDSPTLEQVMTLDPVLIAYTAKRTKLGRTVWNRIGAAYPHESGAGLTLLLDSVPLDGRVILLELDSDDDARIARECARAMLSKMP